jgi:hypothetical protein
MSLWSFLLQETLPFLVAHPSPRWVLTPHGLREAHVIPAEVAVRQHLPG